MVKLLLILLMSGGYFRSETDLEFSNHHNLSTQRQFPVGVWPKIVAESPKEARILWDAQTVYIYAGKTTGSEATIVLNGEMRYPNWSVGWHVITKPTSLTAALALTPNELQRQSSSVGPVVVVLSQKDFADEEALYRVADKKVEELRREGVKEITVMCRGEAGALLGGSPGWGCGSDSLMIYWITDAELYVLSSLDYSYISSLFSPELSIDQSPPPFIRASAPRYSPEMTALR